MSPHEIISMIQNLNEAFLSNDEKVIDQIIAPEYIDRPLGLKSREEYKAYEHNTSQAFSNLKRVLTRITVNRDLVWFRFSMDGRHTSDYNGITATGEEVKIEGMVIYRVRGGRVVEKVDQVIDSLDLLTKLGIIDYKGFPEQKT